MAAIQDVAGQEDSTSVKKRISRISGIPGWGKWQSMTMEDEQETLVHQASLDGCWLPEGPEWDTSDSSAESESSADPPSNYEYRPTFHGADTEVQALTAKSGLSRGGLVRSLPEVSPGSVQEQVRTARIMPITTTAVVPHTDSSNIAGALGAEAMMEDEEMADVIAAEPAGLDQIEIPPA